MDFIKIIFITILRKLPLIFLGSICGLIVGYLINSVYVGVAVALAVILRLYLWILGPMHFVTKQKLDRLIQKDLIVNTLINPYSKQVTNLSVKDDWFQGEGLFDTFIDRYRTQL